MTEEATTPLGPVEAWTPQQVVTWLRSLHLPDSVADEFRRNAVAGADLNTLSDTDLTEYLGLAPLQARKVRSGLTALGVAPPEAAPPEPAPPVEAAAAARGAPPPLTPTPPPEPPAPAPPVAAYAAAGAAAGAAEPDPRACFQPADLQRYNQLKQSISELQALQTSSKVAAAQQYAASMQQQQLAAQGAVPTTRAALLKEEKLVAKYAGGGGGCLCFGKGGVERKQAEAEAQVARLTQQLQQQEQRAATVAAQAQEAQAQLAAWQGKDAELAAARRELEVLVERMFAAPAWRASPRLNVLGDSMRVLEGQAAEAGRHAASFGRGVQLLQSAARSLQEALQAMGRTQMLGAVNMGRGMAFQARTGVRARNQPGRQLGNLAEMAVFRRANEGVAQAARVTEEASAVLGAGMPRVDPGILRSARAGMFANILMGGVVSDAIQLAAVRRSIEQVKVLLSQVQASLAWAQQNLGAHQQRDAALQAQVAGKRAEVEAYRTQALATAAAAV